jgi:multidrug efflux system membrane fusion protein
VSAAAAPPPPYVGPEHQLPAHGPAHSHWARWLLLLGLAGALLILALAIVHHRRARVAPPPPPRVAVTAATAESGDIDVHLQAIGTVTPIYTASMTSEVAGRIVRVNYREGQRVNVGDPLIDIDARPFEATLLQAQGALERDLHILAEAEMDLERYRAAWARHAIARQQLEDQEKLVLQDRGTVKNDEGTVRYAQVQVDFCHITAPIAGRVGLRLVDPGNVVQATGTVVLVVVTQLEPITVVFTISEDQLGEVTARLAQGAKLTVDALDRTGQKKIASGTLLTLDNQIDTTTGTVKARAQFDNKDDLLFPNQFVNARLLVDTHRGITKVPASSIQQNGAESFVYVITEEAAHLRKVTPSVSDAGFTQVEGVAPGDVLANSGFDRLHDGAKVTVTGAPSPTPGGASPVGSATP